MPCKGFIHPLSRENVAFDHFDTDTSYNGRPAFPPWAARFIAAKVQGDVRHATLDLTATRCLGCPRQVFIEVLEDFYSDPEKEFGMHRGSALHEVAAAHWNPATHLSEGSERAKMTVAGEMFGVAISALMDCNAIDKNGRIHEIIDLKFPNDGSLRFRSSKAKIDHAFQLNIARHLLAQQEWATDAGYDPDDVLLTIYDHACSATTGPQPLPAAHMSEEQMLAHRPGGGDFTVQQIIDSFMGGQEVYNSLPREEQLRLTTRRELIGGMALVGRTQFNSKKCGNYCGVTDICDGINAEWPQE